MDFDDGAADQLTAACDGAADALREQRGQRASLTGEALEEFRGPFALLFQQNVAAQLAARNVLIGALEDLARQVRSAKSQAEQARQDLKEQQARALWKLLEEGLVVATADYLRDRIPGFSAPEELSESEVRRPEVGFPPLAFTPHYWAGGGGTDTSSAVPDALKKAASLVFDQADAAELVCEDVVRALDQFQKTCSWAVTDVGRFESAVSQYNKDDRDDAGKMWQIGQAFSTAGQGADLSEPAQLSTTALALAISPTVVRGEALLGFFASASPLELEVASKNPDWLTHLASVSPEQVAAWWAGLHGAGSSAADGYAAQQLVLLKSAPKVFGSLDGIPALDRVYANRIAVVEDIAAAESELVGLQKHAIENRMVDLFGGQRAMLVKEIAYLKKIEAGEVQMYLYDREKSRIVEMIGVPGIDTQRTITYVPGTFTSPGSFYDESVQTFSDYIVKLAPGTVAFVYKDGIFPGENQEAGGVNLLRLNEANDPEIGLQAGRQLADFQQGMRTDPLLQATEQIGIGHSWGYQNLTSSEIHGVEYDKSISLSGAGMHEKWEPDKDTRYSNYVYNTDVLFWAQETDQVWDGKVPSEHDAFANYYYSVPNEGTSWPDSTPLDDHSLPTSDSKDNRELLDDVLREVKK